MFLHNNLYWFRKVIVRNLMKSLNETEVLIKNQRRLEKGKIIGDCAAFPSKCF